MYKGHIEGFEEDADIHDDEDCAVCDVESGISSPEWEPWDEKDEGSNDVSQNENNIEIEHENEGIKSSGFSCQ